MTNGAKVHVDRFVCLELEVVLLTSRRLGLVDGWWLFDAWRLVELLVVLLVDGEMTLQVVGLCELLGAHGAGVWTFTSVDAHVFLESGRVTEGAWTHLALVGLLLGMGSQVNQSVCRIAECFI